MADRPKRILSFLSQEALSRLLQSGLSLLAPLGATVLTVVSGVMNELPLWLLIPLTGLAFMTVIVTINHLDQFFQRRDLRHKLKIGGLKFDRSIDPETREEGYTIGLLLENMGDVPIEYQAKSFTAQLGDVNSREGVHPSKRFRVSGRSTAAYKSGLIPGLRPNSILALKIKAAFKYGRDGGSLNYDLDSHSTFLFETNATGDFLRGELYSGDDVRDESLMKALRAPPPAAAAVVQP